MLKRKKVPVLDALNMLSAYARSRITEQIKSVAFIIIYLIAFQTVILRVPLANAFATAIGIALVIFGLAFFLEGLVLGLMPLGERVGVKLPARVGIIAISIFGLILGFGATLAEPAISALRTAGSSVTAWDSPLLYLILERYTEWLVMSVGIGVGIAVALGMFRFYFNLSIKLFILTIIPILLGISIYSSFDSNLNKIIGLAWDCGAVTTGAVTVPLVLALGIGVSRASSKGKSSSGGFGIILLASAFPILAVLILGIVINTNAPEPVSESEFFSRSGRENALVILGSEDKIVQHAFTHGSEKARRALYSNEEEYKRTILSLRDDKELQKALLKENSLSNWILSNASEDEREMLSNVALHEDSRVAQSTFSSTIRTESIAGFRAVIPLSFLLLIVLIGFLREKLRFKDEVALGILFTLIGMTLLTAGIKMGLASLGGEVGSQLPRAFAKEEKFVDRIVIGNFDKDLLYSTITADGSKKIYFNLMDDGKLKPVEFREENFDADKGEYEYIISQTPLFSNRLTILGIFLVLVFGFGMGYGATLAEPALNAMGITVESITVGAVKRSQIVQIVSIGVGLGIVLGLCRILFDLPLIWLITGSYLFLLPLTILSDDEFTAIAWDSGGVTTGPVTVPLVLAMGLSIGGVLNISDGFGVLALASAFPIITVLLYGLIAQSKQRRSIRTKQNE